MTQKDLKKKKKNERKVLLTEDTDGHEGCSSDGSKRTCCQDQELADSLGCLGRGRGQSFPGSLWAVTEYKTIPSREVTLLSGKFSLGTPERPGPECPRSVLQSGVLPTQSVFPLAALHTGSNLY